MGAPDADKVRARARATRGESASLRVQAESLRGSTGSLADTFLRTLRRHSGPDLGGEADETLSLHLGRLPVSVPLARHRLQRWLRGHGVEPAEMSEVVLAFSEACANAVEHPYRPRRYAFDVEAVCTSDEIWLAVRDYGSWQAGAGDPTRGRGLSMIRRLMDDAEVEHDEDGTRIVMRRARPRSRSR
jgi:serine/threonine-protein kinase RsbW